MTGHPDFLYHATSRENRTSIKEHGLLQSCHPFANEGGCGVFLSSKYGAECSEFIDVWRVDARKLTLVPDDTTEPPAVEDGGSEGDTWWVSYSEDIPPNLLNRLTDGFKA